MISGGILGALSVSRRRHNLTYLHHQVHPHRIMFRLLAGNGTDFTSNPGDAAVVEPGTFLNWRRQRQEYGVIEHDADLTGAHGI